MNNDWLVVYNTHVFRNSEMRFAGVEGGGTTWVAAIADGDPTNIVAIESFATTTPSETLGQVKAWLANYEYDCLGIASFGPVDVVNGVITTTPKPGWKNAAVKETLWNKRVPVRFDTDVNAPAYAHYSLDHREGENSLAYITVGTGVGVGLVVNGKTVHGLLHPEGGHVPCHLPFNNFPGTCPYHANCVEGLTSSGSLATLKKCDRHLLEKLSDDDPVS